MRHRSEDGFALVIALSLMAFVLLLLLSITTLVQVEQRSAAISKSQLIARENAKLGAMVALGKLQQHLGADQRVSAPATLSEPTQTLDHFKSRIRNVEGAVGGTWATYLDEDGQAQFEDDLDSYWTTRNPHWVGVWNSELKDATTGDFNRGQLPVWLVSGNEAYSYSATDSDYPSGYTAPTSVLANPQSDGSVVYMVGEGTSVQRTGSTGVSGGALDSIDGMDGRVKVKKVELLDESGSANGHYAYWVGDESQKANISLNDPYFDATEGTTDYSNRLLAPQRSGLERVEGVESAFSGGTVSLNDDRMQRLNSLAQTAVLDGTLEDPVRQNFHNVTVHSKGLFTDTAQGGLRKDLTAYVERGTGLNDSDPIADPDDYNGDNRFGAGLGFPLSDTNIPKWGAIRDWYQNEASAGGAGAVAVSADMAPTITMARLFIGFSHENGKVRMHLLPTVTLWNPYDVDLQSASYRLKFKFNPKFEYFRIGTSGKADDTPAESGDGFVLDSHFIHPLAYVPEAAGATLDGDTELKYDWEPYPDDFTIDMIFTATFGAGENLVFSVMSDQQIGNPYSVGGSSVDVALQNGFDVDFPTSAYFDVFEITSPPAADETVRYFTSVSPSGSDDTYQLEMNANGIRIFESRSFGDITIGFANVNANAGYRQVRVGNSWVSPYEDEPSTGWRSLPGGVGAFSALIQGDGDTNEPAQPAFCVAMNFLQPFTMLPYRMDRQVAMAKFYRAFASFNLAADELNAHPTVDLLRGQFASNNPADRFDRFSFVASETGFNLDGVRNSGLPWDDNISDSNFGFSLISPRFNVGGVGEYESLSRMAIRQAKRPSSELVSIGQLQQVNLSPFFWNPSFPVGNSEASPYVDRESISGIARDVVSGTTPAPNSVDNDLLDISYLLNDSLWDRYFFSTVTSDYDLDFDDPAPLPNGRVRIRQSDDLTEARLKDFDTSSAHLYNEGAFNVNSTSVEAWKALISGFRDLKIASTNGGVNPDLTVPVSRSLQPLADSVRYAFDHSTAADYGAVNSNRSYYKVLAGCRYLDDSMVDALAQRIVDEVRLRGPFLSLADFVNRRLVAPDDSNGSWGNAREQDSAQPSYETGFIESNYDPIVGLNGINGAVQRAINVSGINGGVNYSSSILSQNLDRVFGVRTDSTSDGADETSRFMQYASSRHYLDTEHLTGVPVGEGGQLMSHAPGFVTQGDLLSMIGSALTARGDTFVIRSYGDSTHSATGEVDSKIWLETLVQRLPDPVLDSDDDMEPDDSFGRRFKVVGMRWLTEADI